MTFQNAIFVPSLFPPGFWKKTRNRARYYSYFSKTQAEKSSCTKHSILNDHGSNVISVGFETDKEQARAFALAELLGLMVDNEHWPRLCVTSDKLVFLTEQFSPLFVDFTSDRMRKRQRAGKQQGLIRACQPSQGMRIIDATAGWGRDAGLLASFGAQVWMLERNPILSALLSDGLSRLEPSSAMDITLFPCDAKNFLQALHASEYPDVIYIDPMHPARQKSALVKKDMQALQALVGVNEDVEALIELSVARAKRRVVVKWPERLPALLPASYCIHGSTVRFDVYKT